MYLLQLFTADGSVSPIDARLVEDGTIVLGRDPSTDWPVVDRDCVLSRLHVEILVDPDGVQVRPLGANGVFDEHGQRLPDSEPSALALPSSISMGSFKLVACRAAELEGANPSGTIILNPPLGTSMNVPSEWEEQIDYTPAMDGSLFEAFCEGAQIDSSQLASEEPAEVMRRAGALYRQMILGIGDLMTERSSARARLQMGRTTISGKNNNPFKWSPSRRLATDLLLAGPASFLSGPDALQASFKELKIHLAASFSGLRASLRHAVEAFAPDTLDARRERTSAFKSRSARCLAEAERRYADLHRQLEDDVQGSLDQAFIVGYEKAEADLMQDGGS